MINGLTTIEILNAMGQMVWSLSGVEAQKTEVNLSDLPNGLYVVKATTNANVSVVKIIKE